MEGRLAEGIPEQRGAEGSVAYNDGILWVTV